MAGHAISANAEPFGAQYDGTRGQLIKMITDFL